MDWVWLSKKVWWVFNDTKDPFGLISNKAQGLNLYNLNFEVYFLLTDQSYYKDQSCQV